MPDIVAWFGRTVQKQTNANPAHGRSLLLAGYRAAGIKLHFFPDKQLPHSRQFGAAAVNRVMCRVTAHPEQAALISVSFFKADNKSGYPAETRQQQDRFEEERIHYL